MYDANAILQASVTKTATFNSAGFTLAGGTPRRGLKARVILTAISGTSPTFAPKIQESNDNSTWSDIAYPVGGDTLTAPGEVFIPFETSSAYVRLVATIGGTTPSCTYSADLGVARP